MKLEVVRLNKTILSVILAVVVAISLTLAPQGEAYASGGPLAAGSGAVGEADGSESPAEEPIDKPEGAESSEASGQPGPSAPEIVYSGVGIAAHGKVRGSGWSAWDYSGAVVGNVGGKGLSAFGLKLTGLVGMNGSIYYRVYKRGSGWKSLVANGKSSGAVRNAEAVKIKLVGDVAKHYDVLYRTNVSGRGWQPWVKNDAKSGVTGKKVRVNALQVKLSPKTEEAAGKSVDKAGIRYEARFKTTGWQAWKGDGKTVGKASGSKVLTGFAAKADAGPFSGGLSYRAYNQTSKWSGWVTDGRFAGNASKRLEAIAVKLTGDLAKYYDVYYRAYSQNAGWLDWAKNGKVAGSTGFNLRLQAFQMKLVRKGTAAPGDTQYPTVNLMEKSKVLNGIDIASWQAGINIYDVNADFVIVKSTQGDWYTNPYFREHADATLASGKLLGIYHFADLRGSAKAQAQYFVNSVKPYLGKAMLFLDYEEDILGIDGTVAWAKTFMDYVYKQTGVKPLIYLSKNNTHYFDWSPVAQKYGLWVAQYPNYDPVYGYLDSPWTDGDGYGAWGSPRLFQYTSQGYNIGGYGSALDFDKFYGSVLSWRKLCR